MRISIWTLLLFCGLAFPAWAGAPDMYCSDHYGRKAAWIENNNQRTLADAGYLANGTPVIYYNAAAADATGLSEDALNFLYAHECAHLVLGHKVRPATTIAAFNEQVDEADCWAANRYYYAGQEDKLIATQAEINALTPEKWVHVPGPRRLLDLDDICRFKTPVWPQ